MLKNLALSTLFKVSIALRQFKDVKCKPTKPCFNCAKGYDGCLKTIHGHSIECQYHHELAIMGLDDAPALRVLYWSQNEAIQWKGDSYKVPVLGSSCPSCGPHN